MIQRATYEEFQNPVSFEEKKGTEKFPYRIRQVEIHSMPDDYAQPPIYSLIGENEFKSFDENFKPEFSRVWVRDVSNNQIFPAFESQIIKRKFYHTDKNGQLVKDWKLFIAQEEK